jgi:allophanate hydrolase subunit 2
MNKSIFIYANEKYFKIINKYLKDKNINTRSYKTIIKKKPDTYRLFIVYTHIHLFDLDFYYKSINSNINIINDRIDFIDDKNINKIIRFNLKIPILNRTKKNNNYNNLIIESIDLSPPFLLKNNKFTLQKIQTINELVIYKEYIKNFINSFNLNNELYLIKIPNKFTKIQIYFLNIDNLIILNSFDVLYEFLDNHLIIKSPSKYEDNNNIFKIIIDDVNKITNYFKLKFGCIEFIINEDNNDIFFYNILNINKLLDKRQLFIKIFNIDIFEIQFNLNKKINYKIEKNIIILNEIFFNYNHFFPEKKNTKKLYSSKKLHIKKISDLDKDILKLIKSSSNIFFKELCYSNIKQFNTTCIQNLYERNKINIMKIINKDNNDINIYNKNNVPDKYNYKICNYLLDNKDDVNCIEIKNNNVKINFLKKTFLCISGSKNITINILRNKILLKYNLYDIIDIEYQDILYIKKNNDEENLNYLNISNGFKFYNKKINDNHFLYNNPKIEIEKKIDKLLNKHLIIKINSNIKLYVLESSFSDKFNSKALKYIFYNKWYIHKTENNYIQLKNKYSTKFIEKYSIKKKKKETKTYRYCKGSIILNNEGIFIILNNNYNYFNGLSLINIISTELWKLNYIQNNSIITFSSVDLDFINYKKNILKNIKNISLVKTPQKKLIYKKSKIILSSFLDKINLIDIELRLINDNHIIVDYHKILMKNNLSIKDNTFIEYSFRQKLIDNYIKSNDIKKNISKIIFGLSFYLIKFKDINLNKLCIKITEIENKICNINNIEIRELTLPIILDKKYFSDKKYLSSFLKINNIKNKLEIKKKINETSFFIIDKTSIISNSFALVPYNPLNRIIMISRNINQFTENGTISIGNFFSNIHYNNNFNNNNILGKTLPIFNKDNNNFVLEKFDIIKLELVDNNSFYSILDHFKKNKYFIKIRNINFNISNYRNFFNNNISLFIKHKQKSINNYNKELTNFTNKRKQNIININSIKSPFDCIIIEIYVKINNLVKFGDKLCKVINTKNNNKSFIKTNVEGLITKINIYKNKHIKKNKIIFNILNY